MASLLGLTLLGLATVLSFVNSQMLYGDSETLAGCGALVYWVKGGYFLPNNFLVEGGRELDSDTRGFPFYICRTELNGKIYIGKFIKSESESALTPSQCWITDGEREHAIETPSGYEVLANYDNESGKLEWDEPTSLWEPPFNAFWAGQAEGGQSIYIGQCSIKNWDKETVIPGTVIGGSEDALMHVAFNRESPVCVPDKFLVCRAAISG